MGSRTLNAKRNIIAGTLGCIIAPLFGFFIKSAITRYFSIEYIGLTSVFASVLQVLNLAELGFSSAIVANLYKPLADGDEDAVRRLLSYYRRVYRIVGVVILTAGILLIPLIGFLTRDSGGIRENIGVLYLLYLFDAAIGYMLFAYKEALLIASQRVDVTKTLYILIYVLKNCLQLTALILFRNFYAFVALFPISTVIYSLLLNLISKKMYGRYYPDGSLDSGRSLKIKEQVVGLSIGNILGVSRNSIDSIIITALFGLSLAGKYSNYYMIFIAVYDVFLVVIRSVLPSVGNSVVSEDVEKNYGDLIRMEFLLNIFITAGAAYLVSLYQPFMKLWMGEGLLFEDSVMMLFVTYFYVLAIGSVKNAYLSALGYWWKAKWLFISEALMNLMLNVLLGKFFGVHGIIVATIITVFLLNYIGGTNLLFKEYFSSGRRRFYFDRVIYTVVAIVACSIAYRFSCQIQYEGIPGIATRFAVCTLTVLIVVPLMLFLFKRKDLWNSVAFIKQIIKA